MMRIAALLLAYSVASTAWGSDPADAVPTTRLAGEQMIYAGSLGELAPPTSKDRKLSMTIRGQAAEEVFDSLGPDEKASCSETKGERLRGKGDVWCMFSPGRGYACFFGFDLRTGKSISGGIC